MVKNTNKDKTTVVWNDWDIIFWLIMRVVCKIRI